MADESAADVNIKTSKTSAGPQKAPADSTALLPSAPYGFLRLSCTVDISTWARITVPLASGPHEDPGTEACQLLATCKRIQEASLDGQDVCVWPQQSCEEGQASSLVVCVQKTGVARVFKALFAQRHKLGIHLTADVKSHVTLKPLGTEDLVKASAHAVARTLQVQGWSPLSNGRWLKAPSLLTGVPGLQQTVQHVAFALVSASHPSAGSLASRAAAGGQTATSGSSLVLQILNAEPKLATPFSAASKLKLVKGSPQETEEETVKMQVFGTKEQLRAANRKLFNTPCIVLPSMSHALIKGIKQSKDGLGDSGYMAGSNLNLPQCLPGYVFEVSQDPEADSGEAGVVDVPACCVLASITTRPDLGDFGGTVKQFADALTTSSFKMWGDRPLSLAAAAAHTTPAAPSRAASQKTAVIKKPAASGWGAAPEDGPSLTSASSVGAEDDGRPKNMDGVSLWVTAANAGAGEDAAPAAASQRPQPYPCMTVLVAGQDGVLEPSGDAADGGMQAEGFWGDGAVGGGFGVEGGGQQAAFVAKIQAGRRDRRGAEKEAWLSLQPLLAKQQANAEAAAREAASSAPQTRIALPSASKSALLSKAGPAGIKRPAASNKPGATGVPGGVKPRATAAGGTKTAKAAAGFKATGGAGEPKPKVPRAAGGAPKAPAAKKQKTAAAALMSDMGAASQAMPGSQGMQVSQGTDGPASQAAPTDTALASQPGTQPVPALAAPAAPNPAKPRASKPPKPAPAGTGADAAGAAGAGGAGSAARKRTKAADMDAAAVEAKVAEKAASGRLRDLSIPEMQCWLRARKLPVGGKKGDLEARVAGALPPGTLPPSYQPPSAPAPAAPAAPTDN